MDKKVSADSIGEITVFYGFSAPPRPTPEEMIAGIRARLKSKIDRLSSSAEQTRMIDPDMPPSAFEISLQRAKDDAQTFENILANVPQGFRLTPVLYSTIDQNQNHKVMREYSDEVRSHFLAYIANHHADELRRLGIAETGITMMKRGLDPADDNGMLYDTNIDHIVERFGGGRMSLEKAVDPLMPPGSKATYLVNHFSNFVFLPVQVHDFKNKLNDFQEASKTPRGQSRWILMMIPEEKPGQSAFVCLPQPSTHILKGVKRRYWNVVKRINHASFTAEHMKHTLEALRQNEEVAKALKTAEQMAAQQGRTVVEMGEGERQGLSAAFNAAVAKVPEKKEYLDTFVRPAIADFAHHLEGAFDSAMKKDKSRSDKRNLIDFLNGEKIAEAREITRNLPLEEASALHAAFRRIDEGLRQMDAFKGRPFEQKKAPRGQGRYSANKTNRRF